MAYAMTKQGSLDNAIVYEFVCDTIADMNAIEKKYKTIGSIAVVLNGESDGLEVYIAGSDRQWNSLSAGAGAADNLTGGGLTIHICTNNEVSNGVPSISEPDESTVYLVSNNGDTGNLYDEYIYVNNAWEKWGSADIDLSAYAPKASPVFTGSISLGRKANTTVGAGSVAEGGDTTASGANSHAEGGSTTASNVGAHAEGSGTTASGTQSHAEGYYTIAAGVQSHAEGYFTTASGAQSHAEGTSTNASGVYSHAEGYYTTALGLCEHVSGRYNKLDTANTWTASTSYTVGALVKRDESYVDAGGTTRNITKIYKCKTANSDSTFNSSKWEEYGQYLFVIGNGIASNSRSNAFSVGWTGNVAEGRLTTASGDQSHAEGNYTTASGSCSHAEGLGATASGNTSHAEGTGTTASGDNSHAKGTGTTASGTSSHAEGSGTIASGTSSHAEGSGTIASGYAAHAEGGGTVASGYCSHAEGQITTAIGAYEHVSGQYNVLDTADTWIANTSYAVGAVVKREESYVDSSNVTRNVTGIYKCTTANSDSTFDSSKWKASGQWLEVVGNGTADNARSNAYALDWDGNERLMGDLYVGCSADSTGGVKLARIPDPPTTDGTYTLQATVSSGTITYSWVAAPANASGVSF